VVTHTVVLDRTDGAWRSLVNTGAYMLLAGQTGPFRLRFGITSVSEGFVINPGESLKVEETVYVKPVPETNDKRQFITLYVHKG